MNPSSTEITLSPHDAYVLARAMAGKDWQDLPCGPLTRLILSHIGLAIPDDMNVLRRLLHDLGENEEARLETRIIKLLSGQPDGLSVREIYRTLRSPRKPVIEALKALEQDGQIAADLQRTGQRGPAAEIYRLMG